MRRVFMMVLVLMVSASFGAVGCLLEAGSLSGSGGVGQEQKPPVPSKRVLIVYFSHSGNTREMANQIHGIVGGDLFEIVTVQPYPQEYKAVIAIAKRERDSQFRPKLTKRVESLDSYDLIFLGYPNWYGTLPMALMTFLEENDLSGKTIVPFCTHGGGGLGKGVEDIQRLAPRATLLEGLAVKGALVKTAKGDVENWLRKLGMVRP